MPTIELLAENEWLRERLKEAEELLMEVGNIKPSTNAYGGAEHWSIRYSLIKRIKAFCPPAPEATAVLIAPLTASVEEIEGGFKAPEAGQAGDEAWSKSRAKRVAAQAGDPATPLPSSQEGIDLTKSGADKTKDFGGDYGRGWYDGRAEAFAEKEKSDVEV